MPQSQPNVERVLRRSASAIKAQNLARFFKTGKGEYGEGDQFMGVVVPDIRTVAKEYYKQVSFKDIRKLIRSPYHEVRLCALIMLVYRYEKSDIVRQRTIYKFYLKNTKYINNWDLVDLSAPHIVGDYLLMNGDTSAMPPLQFSHHSPLAIRHFPTLIQLSQSTSLWERRIAILATFAFIRAGRYQEAFAIAQLQLHDTHDLIHKAVGWMLREVGKRIGKGTLCQFLDHHASTMPRTMLRYAIEHLSEQERRKYMNK